MAPLLNIAQPLLEWNAFVDMLRRQFGPCNPLMYWIRKLMNLRQNSQVGVPYAMPFGQVASQLKQELGNWENDAGKPFLQRLET